MQRALGLCDTPIFFGDQRMHGSKSAGKVRLQRDRRERCGNPGVSIMRHWSRVAVALQSELLRRRLREVALRGNDGTDWRRLASQSLKKRGRKLSILG